MPVLKRSNSAPPDFRTAKINLTTLTTSSASHNSSMSDSSIAPLSDDFNVLIAPPQQPVWNNASLTSAPRDTDGVVALSEVLSIHSVAVRSLGSMEHARGNCKACLFANRADHNGGMGCWKGAFCERCHERHDPLTRRKPKTG